MKLTLDASAALNLVLGKKADELFEKLEQAELVIAPELFFTEVSNAIWKYHQFEQLPLADCHRIKSRCFELVDQAKPVSALIDEAFLLACEAEHSVYDACYLVCSRRYDSKLLTVDRKLRQVAQKLSVHLA